MQVWSKGTSIIGAGAETKAWATNVPISVDSTVVEPVRFHFTLVLLHAH
jgi:hypothetical protein